MDHSPRFLLLVEQAKKRIVETTAEDIKRRLEIGEKLALIDVREESEFAAGHIAGARHIGRGVLERDIEAAIPDTDAEVILYCGGGFRSALAADNLMQMGYRRVISMEGGWRAWKRIGGPVE